jgi:O-antigen ligase
MSSHTAPKPTASPPQATRLALADPGRLFVVVAAIAVIAVSTTMGSAGLALAPASALVAVVAATGGRVEWKWLILVFVLVVMFIPIRLYAIAVNLPFQLEPYRVLTIVIAALWLVALLIQPEVRLRTSGLEGPLGLLALAIVGSIVVNSQSITDEGLSGEVAKRLTFWLGFFIIFYFFVSVVRTLAEVTFVLEALVICGAVLGFLGVVEWKTGRNVFSHLNDYIPGLQPTGPPLDVFRAGLTRAYASAQHPIAFGAALAVLLPHALVFAYRRGKPLWIGAAILIMMGCLASISRTSILMLVVVAVVFLLLRPRAVRRVLPLLLPLAVAVQLALPGTFSTLTTLFLPKGGLVAQQADQSVGSGRVASFGPAIDQASSHPLLGRGFGTRIPTAEPGGPKKNSFILDDEWLSTTLEIGVVGALAWLWIFGRFCTRAWQIARHDTSDAGWMLTAFVASVLSFACGMVFYDAFSFIQVTILMIVMLALGQSTMATVSARTDAPRG